MVDDLFSDDLFNEELVNNDFVNVHHDVPAKTLSLDQEEIADRQVEKNQNLMAAALKQAGKISDLRSNIFGSDEGFDEFMGQMKRRLSENEACQSAKEKLAPLFKKSIDRIQNENEHYRTSNQIKSSKSVQLGASHTNVPPSSARGSYKAFIPGAPVASERVAVTTKKSAS